MEDKIEGEIEIRLKKIFDSFSYSDKIAPVNLKEVFTNSQYLNLLSLMYSATSSHSTNQLTYSLLTNYVEEFIKKIIKPFIESEMPSDSKEFIAKYIEVIDHYEKLMRFVEKFFIYADKKEMLILNFRELSSGKIFRKIFMDQVFISNQIKIFTMITEFLSSRLSVKEDAVDPLPKFVASVLRFVELENSNSSNFVKNMGQKIQQEFIVQTNILFEIVLKHSFPLLISEANSLKSYMDKIFSQIFSNSKVFLENIKNYNEFYRLRVVTDILPKLCQGKQPLIWNLLDSLSASVIFQIFTLMLTADVNLKHFQEILEAYVKKKIQGIVEPVESFFFGALVDFYVGLDKILNNCNNHMNVQSIITKCVEWMFEEYSGLAVDSSTLQTEFSFFLQDKVLKSEIDFNNSAFKVCLRFVPFINPQIFESYFSTFFTKWILNMQPFRDLSCERRLALCLQDKIGEEPCKRFLTVLNDISECKDANLSFRGFGNSLDASNLPELEVIPVFSNFISENVNFERLGVFKPIQDVYDTFFLGQKSSMNKNVHLSYELGSCEALLELPSISLTIRGTPLEIGVISEIVKASGITIEEICSTLTEMQSNSKENLYEKLNVILKKLCDLEVIRLENKSYKICQNFAGDSTIEIFSFDYYHNIFRKSVAKKPQSDRNNRLLSVIVLEVKKIKNISIENLKEEVDKTMEDVDNKLFTTSISHLIDYGIIKRSKNDANTLVYDS